MIKGLHAMFYVPEAEELRAFIRDKLKFPWCDVGDGWLIFEPPAGELGVHPTEDGKVFHEISFWCDDLEKTMVELKERGVEFVGEVEDAGFGIVSQFMMPGGIKALLYQPRYKTEYQTS